MILWIDMLMIIVASLPMLQSMLYFYAIPSESFGQKSVSRYDGLKIRAKW